MMAMLHLLLWLLPWGVAIHLKGARRPPFLNPILHSLIAQTRCTASSNLLMSCMGLSFNLLRSLLHLPHRELDAGRASAAAARPGRSRQQLQQRH